MAEVTPVLKKSSGWQTIGAGKVRYRHIANRGQVFDLDEGVDSAATACRSPEGLADAIGMLTALAGKNERTAGFEKAVYVIQVADDPICKIGVSANPIRRVADLQACHYRELFLYAVIFCPTRRSVTIEQEVLEQASQAGNRLLGEWVAYPPEVTLRMALETARDKRIDVCDGKTWFSNMVERTKVLHKALRKEDQMMQDFKRRPRAA